MSSDWHVTWVYQYTLLPFSLSETKVSKGPRGKTLLWLPTNSFRPRHRRQTPWTSRRTSDPVDIPARCLATTLAQSYFFVKSRRGGPITLISGVFEVEVGLSLRLSRLTLYSVLPTVYVGGNRVFGVPHFPPSSLHPPIFPVLTRWWPLRSFYSF